MIWIVLAVSAGLLFVERFTTAMERIYGV